MKIDMHVHSTYSDGELDPLQILDLCKQNDISVISITDHDNVLGSKKAIYHNPYPDITVIPGIELDAKYSGGRLHILGYNINLENVKLNETVKRIMEDNINRMKSLLFLLKSHYNFTFSEEDISKVLFSAGSVSRPDIARLCFKYGYCSTVREALDCIFEPLHDKMEKKKMALTDRDCIQLITEAGGMAVLAHPVTLRKNLDDTKSYIKILQSYGLRGVEVYHSDHTAQLSREYLAMTNELGLLYSGGSDYHGPTVKPDIQLGRGKNNNLNLSNLSILTEIVRCSHD